MKSTALVHDYLTQCGGAERVALALSDLFISAPLYTSLYDKDVTYDEFAKVDVRPTSLNRFFGADNFRFAAPLIGKAFAKLDLSEFDQVVVSSSGFAHHIDHPNAYVYCHTPPHFLYGLGQYSQSKLIQLGLAPMVPFGRRNDRRAAARHLDHYVANSRATADRIASVYGRDDVPVIHPPVSTSHLPQQLDPLPVEPRALVVARLLPYKRIDLAISACRLARVPLTIVGTGPSERHLRSLAGPGAHFAGSVDDRELADMLSSHTVVLAPGREDFGLVPVEAAYAGRPTVAVAAGGALETIQDGVNGLLVEGTDPQQWARRILEAMDAEWDSAALRETTERFSNEAFAKAVLDWVSN